MEIPELFDYAISVAAGTKIKRPPTPSYWIAQNFVDPISNTLINLERWQGRILNQALQVDHEGRSKYDLVVWSQPKKSGKTAIAGAVAAYVAHNIEAPNEISCVANDQEQSVGRIFAAMLPTLEMLGWKIPVSMKGMYRDPYVVGPNGSLIKAITTNYEKEAGGNQGLSLWSELWAYKGERLQRLWEEMTPPPTRRFSMRWVETYAGFIGENLILQDIYLSVFTDFSEEKIHPNVTKLWDNLPVYEIDGHILVFWDHEHRMPWQTPEYYAKQRASSTIRPNAYTRLHDNRWVESRDTFITYDMWQDSLTEQIDKKRSVYALDASKNNASTALVGCYREGEKVVTSDVKIWEAESEKEINFREIEKEIISLWENKQLIPPLYYDAYQCVKLAQDLRAQGIPCEEFGQGQPRVKADTFLYKLYLERKIVNPNNPILRRHVLAASAKDYGSEKIRIVKPTIEEERETDQQKVDAAVAQSMSAYMAYLRRSGSWGVSGQ